MNCFQSFFEGWSYGFDAAFGARGEVCFEVDYSGTDLLVVSAQNTVTLNDWQHYVLTWDGSLNRTGVIFYTNGVKKTTSGAGQDGTGSINSDGGNVQTISSDNTTRVFDGLIDEVRIYNRALSASEIQRLYNMGR